MILNTLKPSHGAIDEQPRVIQAIGTMMLDEKNRKRFVMLALIRHPDPERRRAVIESTESLAHCAKELDTQCTYEGIFWNGTYRVGTPDQMGIVQKPRIVEA